MWFFRAKVFRSIRLYISKDSLQPDIFVIPRILINLVTVAYF